MMMCRRLLIRRRRPLIRKSVGSAISLPQRMKMVQWLLVLARGLLALVRGKRCMRRQANTASMSISLALYIRLQCNRAARPQS